MPSTTSRAALGAVLVLVVVSSGCTLLPADDGPDPIGTDAGAEYAAVDGLSATLEVRTVRGNETATHRLRLKMRPGERKLYQRVVSPGPRQGNVVVRNGSTNWRYNATENSVTRTVIERDGNRTGGYREFVQRVFNSVNDERGTADGTATRTVGVSALPVVPANGPRADDASAGGTLEDYAVTYRGTDTVDGREAHVIHLVPSDGDGATVGNRTLWIDTDHYVPLKVRQHLSVGDERVVTTVTFRNVTVDPGIPAGTFDYEPPENATVERSRYETARFENRSAAAAEVPFDAPAPETPEGFDLDRAVVTGNENVTALTLQYDNGTADLRVTKQATEGPPRGPDDGENVTVAGTEGVYVEYGTSGMVYWRCDGYGYAVAGDLPKERLLAVAESVGCG